MFMVCAATHFRNIRQARRRRRRCKRQWMMRWVRWRHESDIMHKDYNIFRIFCKQEIFIKKKTFWLLLENVKFSRRRKFVRYFLYEINYKLQKLSIYGTSPIYFFQINAKSFFMRLCNCELFICNVLIIYQPSSSHMNGDYYRVK